jgi:5-formyltetrahydrofolate cyclo-ligase
MRQLDYKSPKLYGLAFDCQEVKRLDIQPWDVKLDGVITPNKIIK